MKNGFLFVISSSLWMFVCAGAEASGKEGATHPQSSKAQSTTAGSNDSAAASVFTDGQFGLPHLLLPEAPIRHLSLGMSGGYGFFESMGEVEGSHHRMQGDFTIGASPISSLGLSLSLFGYRDTHPSDDIGDDSTAVGAPSIVIRGGHRLGAVFELGAAARLTFPGNDAPSFAFSATSADFSLLLAAVPKHKPWMVLFSVGYRLDNSDNLIANPASLRQGDRISLNASRFDAVPVGIGVGVHVKRLNLFAELDADILVGAGAPTNTSPISLTLGGELAIVSGLNLFLTAEPLLTPRPSVSSEASLSPTPPRFTCILGLTYTFDFDKAKSASSPKEVSLEGEELPVGTGSTVPPPVTPKASSVTGRVQDEDGNPVGGAEVTLSLDEHQSKTTTDADGNYRFGDVPGGTGTLTIQVEGFDPFEQTLEVGSAQTNPAPNVLTRPPLNTATQLKGLIRSVDGTPLRARITISPGDISIETNGSGYFIRDLAAGSYIVKISANGFVSQKKTVQIETAGVTILNVDLTPKH